MRIKLFLHRLNASTIYESGHSFNYGSVRKNEDKFLLVATDWLMADARAIRIKKRDELFFMMMQRIDESWIWINEFLLVSHIIFSAE